MKKYYYVNEAGEQVGPMELEALIACDLEPSTLVWTSGMPQWCEASQLAELAGHLRPSLPPQPPTRNGGQTQEPQSQTNQQYQQSYGQQQHAYQAQYGQQDVCPPTYTALAIIMALICCLPMGIAALIYGSRVSQDWNAGNYAGAKKNSDTARTCLIVGVSVGLLVYVLLLILAAMA